MPRQKFYVLTDWLEDRLPVCTSCGQEIHNGQRYTVVQETNLIACSLCADDSHRVREIMRNAEQLAVAKETAAKERKAKQKKIRIIKEKSVQKKIRIIKEKPSLVSTVTRQRGHPFTHTERACLVCDRRFQPRSHGQNRPVQRYCSPACTQTGRRTRPTMAICPACDQRFRTKHGSRVQTCCSRSCARWWIPRRLRNPHPVPVLWSVAWGRACRGCGQSDQRHRGQGYCPRCYRKLRAVPTTGRAREQSRAERAANAV